MEGAEIDAAGMLATPILLVHHSKNHDIDVAYGHQAYLIFETLSFPVTWEEYDELNQGVYWIKEPEGFDAMARFLRSTLPKKTNTRTRLVMVYLGIMYPRH